MDLLSATADTPATLPRAQGRVELAVHAAEGRTRLDRLYQAGSGKVRLPRSAGPGREAVLINTAGGLTDGDLFEVDIGAGAASRLLVTSQAAEKLYRSRGGEATITNRLAVGDNALLEWLPQETIMFDGARLRRRLLVDVDPGGACLLLEALVFGRTAMGEAVRSGALVDQWDVRRGGELLRAERFRIAGDIDAQLERPAIMAGARACATLLFVKADAERWLQPVRDWLESLPGRAGVTARPGILTVRLLAADGRELRTAIAGLLRPWRGALHGQETALPRSWEC